MTVPIICAECFLLLYMHFHLVSFPLTMRCHRSHLQSPIQSVRILQPTLTSDPPYSCSGFGTFPVNYSGRKRAPLPPQSMQFRDAKSTVPYAASDAPSGPAHSPRARHTADLARPEPRHQESAVGRTDHGPPSAPSGRRSRFTDPPGTMDVDMPGPPVAARPQGGMYADREEVVKDAPKGPRAMAFRGQPYVSPTTSPTTSTFPHRQPPHHMPRAPGQMAGGRLPPRPEPFRDHQSRVSPDNLRAVPDAVCHDAVASISFILILVPGAMV